MTAGSLLQGFIQLLADTFFGNTLRFLRHFRLPRADRGPIPWHFVGTLGIILTYGLVMLFSASYSKGYYEFNNIYEFIQPQIVIALGGFVLMLALSNLNYRSLKYAFWPLYLLTLILLVVALFSEPQNNCHRWVYFYHTSFQPSELAKFCVIVWIATYTDAHYERRGTLVHGLIVPLLPLLPIIVLLRLEPHNSAILLTVFIAGTMLLCGGCGLRWMPLAGVAGVAGMAAMLLNESNDVANQRLGAWGVFAGDASALDWQTRQSIYSIASGGLGGLGIGNGRQKHQWLPEAINDFIFSVLCEELGFIGAVICMLLFALLIVQGVFIALRSPDFCGTMMALGIIGQIAWQVLCHIGVVTATIPNTGISLPFFSSGGTSLLVLLAEMGVLLSIGRAGNARAARARHRAAAADQQVYHRVGVS